MFQVYVIRAFEEILTLMKYYSKLGFQNNSWSQGYTVNIAFIGSNPKQYLTKPDWAEPLK